MPPRRSSRLPKPSQKAVEALSPHVKSFFQPRHTHAKEPILQAPAAPPQAKASAPPTAPATRKTPAKYQPSGPRKDSVRPESEEAEDALALPISSSVAKKAKPSKEQQEAKRFKIIDDDAYAGEVTYREENVEEWQDARDFFYWVICKRAEFDVSEALRKISNAGFVFRGDILLDMKRYETGQEGFEQVFFDLYGILPFVPPEMAYQHFAVIAINEKEINAHATMMAFDIVCGPPSTRPECVIKASTQLHRMLHHQIQLRLSEDDDIGWDKCEDECEQFRLEFWTEWRTWNAKYIKHRGQSADSRFTRIGLWTLPTKTRMRTEVFG